MTIKIDSIFSSVESKREQIQSKRQELNDLVAQREKEIGDLEREIKDSEIENSFKLETNRQKLEIKARRGIVNITIINRYKDLMEIDINKEQAQELADYFLNLFREE